MNTFKIINNSPSQRGSLKFRFLTGDVNWQEYGGKFVSKRLNNGEFAYWLVIEVVNLRDACDDDNNDEYAVSLLSVSPTEAGQTNVDAALSCCGFNDEELTQADSGNELIKVEALAGYGIFATLWSETGNNLNQLMRDARAQANASQLLYGFMMDSPQNRIGSSGWDCQRGDITAGLRRMEEQ